MKKLSGKEYWDSLYENLSEKKRENKTFRSWVKHLTRDYSNYILSDILYPTYLPKSKELKIIEIGCAPGKYLIGFHNRYGYKPYGVEYSEKGCAITKENFKQRGLNPENIICADFFDEKLQSENKGRYDLVFSRGFIEHFDNPSDVIDKHLDLLENKGYLIVMIPNLQGLSYYLLKFLNIDSLKTHNFSVMNKDVFKNLFENKNLNFLYCDYVGFFSIGLMNTNKKWKYHIYRILLLIQRPFDFIWRSLFGKYHLKSRYSSPYILFIGRKE